MMRIKSNNPVVVGLAVLILLFFLHWIGLTRGLEGALSSLIQPLSGKLYSWSSSISSSYSDNQDIAYLQAEIARLKGEVVDLTVANSSFLEIAQENNKLRKALDFQDNKDVSAVIASIIAKEQAGEDRRDLVINRGSQDGLRPGLGVINEDGMIVGKVMEVKDRTAKICLATSPGCRLAAAVQNQLKSQGLTDGDLGLTIKMSYIPQLEKIAQDDLVITSGLDGDIPRGFVIGRVTQIINESNEVWQEATIEPLINFDNLTVVSAIVP